MGDRRGKSVCSTTCRVNKHNAFKYYDTLFKDLEMLNKNENKGWDKEKIFDGIKFLEKKKGQTLRVFEVWMELYDKRLNKRKKKLV